LLADPRNADTPVLLHIAYVFKNLHNAFVDRLALWASEGGGPELTPNQTFVLARALTVRTWHTCIQSDVIAQVCRPIDPDSGPGPSCQDFEDVVHAAFRSFHSLVLGTYRLDLMGELISIDQMLAEAGRGLRMDSPGGKGLKAWRDIWQPDWSLFFFDAPQRKANTTRFTPSFVFSKGGDGIAKHDFLAARRMGVNTARDLGIAPERMGRLYAMMDRHLGSGEDWTAFGQDTDRPMPTMLALLADGFCEGDLGADSLPAAPVNPRLGPVASRLVRDQLEIWIHNAERNVVATLDAVGLQDVTPPVELPGTFLEILSFIEDTQGSN